MVRSVLTALALALLLLLCGCGGSTKYDIMTKAENCKTKEELQKACGKPDSFSAVEMPLLGQGEVWTYKAKDGTVTFRIFNGKILARETVDQEKK